MDSSFFILILFLLSLAYLYLGARASKLIEGREDYFLAKRELGTLSLTLTIMATQIGGGLILGVADEAYRSGFWVFLWPFGTSLGLLVLAMGLGKKMRLLEVKTIAEIFEKVYGSSFLRHFASFLSMLTLFFLLTAQGIASRKFMLSLGVDNQLIFASFWTVVIIYTVLGGLRAVVYTDVLQSFFICIVFACAMGVSFQMDFIDRFDSRDFVSSTDQVFSWMLMPFLFMIIGQDMGQRCFAAKTTRMIFWSMVFASIGILCICVVPIYLGMQGKILGIAPSSGSSILISTLMKMTSPRITALAAAGVFVAILSTADSLLCAISSNLSQDFSFLQRAKGKNIRLAQMFTALIGIFAMALSFFFSNISDVMMQSYEISVSAVFVSVFFALIIKKPSKIAAYVSVLGGVASVFLLHVYPLSYPRVLLSLLVSFCLYICVHVLDRSKPQSLDRQL